VSDARERWKEKHRRRRVRARWLDPLKNVVSYVLIAAAVVCLVLTPLVHPLFLLAFFATLIGGLLVRGMSIGEIFSHGGVDPGYTGDGGGDGGDC
jgi:hypothetical protein